MRNDADCLNVSIFVIQILVIMNECFGKKFILNGELQDADSFDNSLVYGGDSVYEVIKMVKGNPLFFYDHMERLAESVKLQHKKELAGAIELRRDILYLSRSNKKKETNLKIVFNYNAHSENYLVYFIEPIYPTEAQYRKGVKGVLFYGERSNPTSKVINHKLRSTIYHKLILDGAYEALLVNENNYITEGSRSNIFFRRGEILLTAPDSLILNGITRKYILEICRENNIAVRLESVRVEDIKNYDEAFMTGTSPTVLPFYCIDNYKFKVNGPIIILLRQLYQKKARESIHKFLAE